MASSKRRGPLGDKRVKGFEEMKATGEEEIGGSGMGLVKKFNWAVKEEKLFAEGLERGLFKGGLESGELAGEGGREKGINWFEGEGRFICGFEAGDGSI